MFTSKFQQESPRLIKGAVVALLVTLILAAIVFVAAADGVYHAEHVPFHPMGDQPLRSGFVQNIHANGPQVYAQERYVLNGAMPNTEFYIKPLIYLADAGCTEGLIPFPIENSFTTNGAGNGTTLVTLTPDVAAGLAGMTVNVEWQLLVGAADGPVAYQSDCAVVTLD